MGVFVDFFDRFKKTRMIAVAVIVEKSVVRRVRI